MFGALSKNRLLLECLFARVSCKLEPPTCGGAAPALAHALRAGGGPRGADTRGRQRDDPRVRLGQDVIL